MINGQSGSVPGNKAGPSEGMGPDAKSKCNSCITLSTPLTAAINLHTEVASLTAESLYWR